MRKIFTPDALKKPKIMSYRCSTRFKPPKTSPESLAFALDGAAHAVDAVRAGGALPAALARIFTRIDAPAARGAIQDLACRALRALGRTDALIATLVRRPPPPLAHFSVRLPKERARRQYGDRCGRSRSPSRSDGDDPAASSYGEREATPGKPLKSALESLLACALALLSEADHPTYAPYTVVDQTVQAADARAQWQPAKGLVNAVLRRFLRMRAQMLKAVLRNPVARWNYPRWWIDAVRAAWPVHWEEILSAGNTHPPMTLRVNARRTNVAHYLEYLRARHISALAADEYAIQLTRPRPVEQLPGFKEGLVSVQDAGAQCAAKLLNVRDGLRVLDACAAPGGKTGHLLELANLELVALDIDGARAARIDANLQRLRLRATVCVGDAAQPAQWWDGRRFDRILLDAPCTGSGVARRHPDLRWLRRASDIAQLAARQQQMLRAVWPLLNTGGELLYSTCSVFPEEGEAQARAFERAASDAVRLPAPGQLLPSVTPAEQNHDGFFYARFLKR
ncbi:16S rRNA methyltransferase B (sun protein) [Candidatus Glomeribacter gigasporarum BEG34]|uniref:16S rRNA (cytosine(967)-C(5))-methyltransferase n=2 Tax=Candidatus Glomeribacter gigasporarum TaxID=132144 RepID=G2J9Y5_9BURK|nr:16S rRNA methyltransferase B (sun protein) [Candidatus Glomeribacter gigasporarum BEG34]